MSLAVALTYPFFVEHEYKMDLVYGKFQKVWVGFLPNTNYVWLLSDSSTVSYTDLYQSYLGANNIASWPGTPAPLSMATMACADFQPTGFPYTVVPSSVPMTTSAMGACAPNVCNSYCQQHECRSGSCDLYYSGVANNPCACDTCLDPSQYCTQTACNATCGAASFECNHGDCDQGICDCFICDCE